MPLFPPCFPVCTSPGSGSSRRKQKASQYKMQEKKKQSSYRKNKTKYGRRDKKKKPDAIHDFNIESSHSATINEKEYKVAGLCKCFSLCDVFGSKRRYRQQSSSYPDVGYESGMSTSSPTINNSSFDNKTQQLTPLEMRNGDDEMSCGSTDSKSSVTRSNASDASLLDSLKMHDTKMAQIADISRFDSKVQPKKPTPAADISLIESFKVQYHEPTPLNIASIQNSKNDLTRFGLSNEIYYGSSDSSSQSYVIPGNEVSGQQKTVKNINIKSIEPYDGQDHKSHLNVRNEIRYGSCDSSCESDFKKKASITPLGVASNSCSEHSDSRLSREYKTSINEDKNIIDPYDVKRIDEAETALIEHQLDEMSNQSSCLSFESDDFLEDDHEEGNYSAHGDGVIDLMPISEETGEDSE